MEKDSTIEIRLRLLEEHASLFAINLDGRLNNIHKQLNTIHQALTINLNQYTQGISTVFLPDNWPAIAANSQQSSNIIAFIKGQFVKGTPFKNEARNRQPYRFITGTPNRNPYKSMKSGEKIEQYFIAPNTPISSFSLYFYKDTQNGILIFVNIYIVLSNLTEHCVVTKLFENDDIRDGGAVHIWLEPELCVSGQILRIEIIAENLKESDHFSVAFSKSEFDTICPSNPDVNPEYYSLCFSINKAPSLDCKKQFAFISGCHGDAFRYRCDHVAESLSSLGYTVDVYQPSEHVWKLLLLNYKVIIIHRIPYDHLVDVFLKSAKTKGISVIYDTDDIIFNPQIAQQMSFYNVMSADDKRLFIDTCIRHARTISKCELVTVSTDRLKQEILQLWPGKKVEIIRNRLSKEMCDLAYTALLEEKPSEETVTIAYFSGTFTHQMDFATCESAVLKILEKFPFTRLLIAGCFHLPASFSYVAEKIETLPFLPWESLPMLYRKVDINLAPLEYDNTFTECKSELKFLEAALLSVPTVAAKTGAYAKTIENGVDGILCSSPEEWFYALEQLILDPISRNRIGQMARKKVLRDFTTSSNLDSIKSTYGFLIHSNGQ